MADTRSVAVIVVRLCSLTGSVIVVGQMQCGVKLIFGFQLILLSTCHRKVGQTHRYRWTEIDRQTDLDIRILFII